MTPGIDGRRILVIDDNRSIHEDFGKILCPEHTGENDELLNLEAQIFGEAPSRATPGELFHVDHAFQGNEGFEMVARARREGRPYAIAFVDVRMPPGCDGVETVEHIYEVDDEIQVVPCTAYSDRSWQNVIASLGQRDGFLILEKPFDAIEVLQFAHALSRKWVAQRAPAKILRGLERLVVERTERLRKEVDDQRRVESELRLAQKLESIGQLAAGVAHEINTPIQYIGDNTIFLKGVFFDILHLIEEYQAVCHDGEADFRVASGRLAEVEADIDLTFIREHVPSSIESSLEGIERVADIVRSLREFAHPDSGTKKETDLNQAIRSTATVAANEYKSVADLELDLGELPSVLCHPGDLNQVILNLIVNAAHAIEATVAGTEERGRITIRTRADERSVVITVEDTGGGIPEAISDRVFDPFFTTKEVGKGTGQGLATARTTVVDKHEGEIGFAAPGGGTIFTIRLPVHGS